MKTHWKGYAIPGPQTWAERSGECVEVAADQTLDSLSGHFKIFQYKDGHRFSTDDLLVAWFGTTHGSIASSILDLGSGIGAVAMIAAWRLPGARLTTIEAQAISVELARKSSRYNGVESRFEIRHGDFRDPKVISEHEKFDLILGSPPYFPVEDGLQSEHEQKSACRFELRGSIFDYCQTAKKHLNLGGMFACVFPVDPAHQLKRVLDAAQEAGLVIVRRRNVVLKEGASALLGLFLMMNKEDLPSHFRDMTWNDPPLIIRLADGSIHPEYSLVKMSIGFSP